MIIGILMLLLKAYVVWDVFQANTVRPNQNLSMSIWFVLLFVALVFVIVIRMSIKFLRVPGQ